MESLLYSGENAVKPEDWSTGKLISVEVPPSPQLYLSVFDYFNFICIFLGAHSVGSML